MTGDTGLRKGRMGKCDDICADATVSEKQRAQARRRMILFSPSKKLVLCKKQSSNLKLLIKLKRLY